VGVVNVNSQQSYGILKEFGIEQIGHIWPLRQMDAIIQEDFYPNPWVPATT
jgi:hypothetical protein